MKIILSLLIFISFSFANILPKNKPCAGGVAVIKLKEKSIDNKPLVTFRDKKVATIFKNNRWYAIVGINLEETAKTIDVNVSYKNGKKETKKIKLQPVKYQKQYITLKTNKHVTPTEVNLDRHYDEKKEVRKILDSFSDDKLSILKIKNPVGSKPRGDFGKRRYFNNQPRKPHSGVDLSGKLGDNVYSALDGVVVMAKELFFSGNVIYIDHSSGIISMYAHLNSFDVKVGDIVKRGQLIGKVGKTGRVTGPHLHFGLSLNGNMVNPELFL